MNEKFLKAVDFQTVRKYPNKLECLQSRVVEDARVQHCYRAVEDTNPLSGEIREHSGLPAGLADWMVSRKTGVAQFRSDMV